MTFRAALIQAALAASLAGCFSTHVAPRVEGHVVDARTGKPVAGAEVFATYSTGVFDLDEEWFERTVATDSAWATSDADGRFVLPERRVEKSIPVRWGPPVHPWLKVYHPDYGVMDWPNNVHYPKQNQQRELQFWDSVVIEIAPWKHGADTPVLQVTGAVLDHCKWGRLTRGGCRRLCEISVGVDACERFDVDWAQELRARETARAAAPPVPVVTPDGPVLRRPRVVERP